MYNTWKQRDFTGGENRAASLDLLAPNQIFLGMNCVLSPDGSIETRKGKNKVNTNSLGSGKVKAIFRWAKENGSKYITIHHGTTLYNFSWDGVNALSSMTAVKTHSSLSAKLRGVVWKDNLILVNGVANPFRFDGVNCYDLAGSPPKADKIAVYASKLWLNDTATPNAVRWSGVEDYDTWDALDTILIRSGDGDKVQGFAPQQGGMVIFKDTSIWTLYGTNVDDIAVVLMTDSVGCIAPDSIISDGFFAGSDNFYKFTLASFAPFPPTHKTYLGDLTAAQKQEVSAVFLPYQQRIIVNIKNYRQICVEIGSGAIFTWSELNANCLACAQTTGDDGSLLVGDALNGKVFVLNNGENDDGAEIPTDVRLAYYDLQSSTDKVFRAMRPNVEILQVQTGRTPVVNIMYDVDKLRSDVTQTNATYYEAMSWSDDPWNSKQWGGATVFDSNEPWKFMERGRFISLRCASGTRIKVKGFELKYRNAGRAL